MIHSDYADAEDIDRLISAFKGKNMTALSTTQGFVTTPSDLTIAGKIGPLYASAESNLDADTRDMISVLGRTLFFLSLGTVAVVAFAGQLPLFFLPLGLFLFFGSALQWRQTHPARAGITQQKREGSDSSKMVLDRPRKRLAGMA